MPRSPDRDQVRLAPSVPPGSSVLGWCGGRLDFSLAVTGDCGGKAFFRTDLSGEWSDIELTRNCDGVYSASLRLPRVGVFSGKAYFVRDDNPDERIWTDGDNVTIKVLGGKSRSRNAIYTAFPRQMSGFRGVLRRLDVIMDAMGFDIVQVLPPFPVPTTEETKMGKVGCPFAALDFYAVDPALAEFDRRTTPMDQFLELIDGVHAKGGRFFVDIPANHTGWGSVLQTEHPEWFRRNADGTFHSPGAWGVIWADLVELDYSKPGLAEYMAEVFRFWCRKGVDGFRCDAGYMIPVAVWRQIVREVRKTYPETVFMLEGLGGDPKVTDDLLSVAGLDWAYSELFQTYDRAEFERYLPTAIYRSEHLGTLVHFAETHDNDRLAKRGKVYARLRVQLAALLSWQGAWGITNGVEWYATEKIDVHGGGELNWGATDNMVGLIGELNAILKSDPSFSGPARLELVTRGGGNVLAVLRTAANSAKTMILANLDCESEGTVDSAYLASPVTLAPGEVRRVVVCDGDVSVAAKNYPAALVTVWRYPFDLKRDVPVVSGERVRFVSDGYLRVTLADEISGEALVSESGMGNVELTVPNYIGDGTFNRALRVEVVVATPEDAVRTSSRMMVAPPLSLAAVRCGWRTQDLLSRNPDARVIFSNVRGSALQARIAWGTLASKYDAFLAANPNPKVPSDRLIVWTRTRLWLTRNGFSHPLDDTCLREFHLRPSDNSAAWIFAVPLDGGTSADVEVSLALSHEEDCAEMSVAIVGGKRDGVRIIARPDLEWRSFHEVTKAYAGAESRFAAACRATKGGFVFSPYDDTVSFGIENATFHESGEWQYGVRYREESERGLECSGDLFSPGWIGFDAASGGAMRIRATFGKCDSGSQRPSNRLPKADARKMSFLDRQGLLPNLREAMKLYVVDRDKFRTVIAGYPWFLDWGRDTFIFLRGFIAAGGENLPDALRILNVFASFEEDGTLPNIIFGDAAGNRDTSDGPLWFIRCVQEFEKTGYGHTTDLRRTCHNIVNGYLRGTPNGICVDSDSMLVWSPSHFTWMDTNYPACTPREGYPVEIQALWISALRYLGMEGRAKRAEESVRKYFATPDGYCDVLLAAKGESAAHARADRSCRPNQLLLVTLNVIRDPVIVRATSRLIVPGGIRTLSPEDGGYCGVYSGDEDTRRKPAYHNGTAWGWLFPSYVEALVICALADREYAARLLATCVDNLNTGCLGHLSEIADGDSPHAQKGCAAQAWSVSETFRVLNMFSQPTGE